LTLVVVAADPVIALRVSPEVKTLLRAIAQRERTSESALVRQLIETMLRMQVKAGLPRLAEIEKESRDARVYVRLKDDVRVLLMKRAVERGMPSATYLAGLAECHLRGAAPIPKEELLALKRSIAELKAIGRHLNQIARVLNQGGTATPGRQELHAMLKVAEGLRDHFKALLDANANSWRADHAEKAH